jgi:hypothetical protein
MGQLALSDRGAAVNPSDLRRAAVALAVALLALNVLDLMVTNLNVGRFGAVEINPLMAPLIGTHWAPIVKIGIPLGIIALAPWGRSARMLGLLRTVVAIYVVIAVIGVGQLAFALA